MVIVGENICAVSLNHCRGRFLFFGGDRLDYIATVLVQLFATGAYWDCANLRAISWTMARSSVKGGSITTSLSVGWGGNPCTGAVDKVS